MPKTVCLVTPDLIGPMKNGGIGTACYWLARFLTKSGYKVTALYTGPLENSTVDEVRKSYAEHHIKFHALAETKAKLPNYYGIDHTGIISEQVYSFLKGFQFDVIHFQDWQGNGFASLQAKKMGIAFAVTTLVVGVHSPLLWEQEGMQIWSRDPIADCKRAYMEKYSIEQADAVWSPSDAMFQWLRAHNIVPKGETRVIRNLIRLDEEKKHPSSVRPKDLSHLVFFGRLETRKGIELFCQAINKMVASGQPHGIKRITFLGKIGSASNGVNAFYYINQAAAKWKERQIEWKVIDNFDAFQAIRYIEKTGAISVMPSLLDNYPYTIIECLEKQIPCLVSSVGGIPEMISSEALFDPNVTSLTEALYDRETRSQKIQSFYCSKTTQEEWLEYSRHLEQKKVPRSISDHPSVSICIAYYNYGRYLPQLLKSIKCNTYKNFEVIVVNDGSTDPVSKKVFEQQAEEFSSRGWKFLSHENQGIGATRNFAASQATGKFLIFMDADNIAAPEMISTFVRSMECSNADALTCLSTVFKGDDYPDDMTEVSYVYRPLGPVLEIAMLENVYGDANAIVKKSVFDQIGGFKTDRGTSFEDWELFSLLALNGYAIDVIPESLFYYRHQEQGFSRTTNQVANHKRVMSAYLAHADKIDWATLLQRVLIPYYYKNL